MRTHRDGRHENGQNFLTDPSVLDRIEDRIARTHGPIVEIGPGQGSLTSRLTSLQRPLTVVEIDPTLSKYLQDTFPSAVQVVNDDFLKWPLPSQDHAVVGNLPFHLTTAVLRKLLHQRSWTTAVLLVQWEVARRRAGVGGASMMTAQWWPWVDFTVHGKVDRFAFRPAPSVDGGLLEMKTRPQPLLEHAQQASYRQFVHRMFTGRGRGMSQILGDAAKGISREAARSWLRKVDVPESALPKDLTADQWTELYNRVHRAQARARGRRRKK